MECYKDNVSMNTNVKGNYTDLWLKEGKNTIEISGATKVEITPKWRY
jgi:phage-related protein